MTRVLCILCGCDRCHMTSDTPADMPTKQLDRSSRKRGALAVTAAADRMLGGVRRSAVAQQDHAAYAKAAFRCARRPAHRPCCVGRKERQVRGGVVARAGSVGVVRCAVVGCGPVRAGAQQDVAANAKEMMRLAPVG